MSLMLSKTVESTHDVHAKKKKTTKHLTIYSIKCARKTVIVPITIKSFVMYNNK